ncbi:hypothetical protein PIB30_051728 [Stylosanthes scabra]|uniref:Transposase MuDR plant domain-containing protein n=1 Tax=Stylosanthes scabra TaxID=79078 RepID=A0ABU6SI23_9FABA|nr:hypothetical protein [Stylosanthes scabra]
MKCRCILRMSPQIDVEPCHRFFFIEVGEAGSPSGSPIAVAPVRIAEPSMPDTEMKMDNSESDWNYDASFGSEFECQEGDECIPDMELHLDEGASDDLLKAGMCNYYNIDGGTELRVGHRMHNREAVHTAVKNYSIRRNAEYRVVESNRMKYHCRCKHLNDGCPWSIRVALRQNLGYW